MLFKAKYSSQVVDSFKSGPWENVFLEVPFTLHGESRFTDINSTNDKDTSNRVGFRQNINANSGFEDDKELKEPVMEYYVLPEGFKEIIAGFHQKRAKALLVKKGWLTLESDGSTPRRKLPGTGQTRCYIFTEAVFE